MQNYVERKIKNVHSSVAQITTIRNLVLNFKEALNLTTSIESTWNSYPYSCKSLLCPANFINPHAALYSLRIDFRGYSITEAMSSLMSEVIKGAMEFIIDSRALEKGTDPEFDQIKPGHTVCYNKSEDNDQGLIFTRVKEKSGSDFLVIPANSDAIVRMSKQRIILLPSSSPFELESKE